MVRELFSKIFSSRAFYIVFSLLVSIALWMFVEINENQIQTHTVPGVRVVRLNEQVLNDRNFLVSSMDPETVELTFKCPRSLVQRLNKDTLSVQIDLASITSRGNKILRHEIVFPTGLNVSEVIVESSSVGQISLYIDRIYSKPVRVSAPYTGGVSEGFIADPVEITPREIMVYGPAEVVSRVGAAQVRIVRENLTTTFTENLGFVLLDVDGEELDDALLDQLTVSEETIHINIPVRMQKEVTLTVDLGFGAGATSQNTTFEITPRTIIIAGDPEDVRDLNTINLGTIDLTRFEYTDTVAFPIAIPNNVTPLSGETEARVMVEVKGLTMRYLSVSNTRIHYVNEPSGHTAEIRTQSLDMRIRCRPEDFEEISETNIRIVADLRELGPGTQRVPARVYVDGIDGAGAIGNYMIMVAIIREEYVRIPTPDAG